MRCPSCTAENAASRRFCAECGAPLPSPCLGVPPVDFCSGVSPSPAKSRPAGNPSAAGTSAVIAVGTQMPSGGDLYCRNFNQNIGILMTY